MTCMTTTDMTDTDHTQLNERIYKKRFPHRVRFGLITSFAFGGKNGVVTDMYRSE